MTDPVTVAREVLLRDAEAGAIDDRVGYDASSSLYVENGWSAPALARAVVELTAERDAYREENTRFREQAARVKALADQYDAEARLERREGDVTDSINTQATADRIRTALNGEAA